MNAIWKYQLETIDEQFIEIPNGFEPLFVETQKGKPCLWCRVDPQRSKVRTKIITHGTGHSISDKTGKHLGSYLIHDDSLVFHVFLSA